MKNLFSMLLCMSIFCFSCSCNTPEGPVEDPEKPENGEPVIMLDMTRWTRVSGTSQSELTAMWEAMHLASTLQGLVNREEPRLFLRYVTKAGVNIDDFWWNKCTGKGKWLEGRPVTKLSDPVKAVEMFRDEIKGLVVYDPAVASTSNVASTVAGVEDLVAVRYDPTVGSMYSRLVKLGIPVKVWLVNEDGTSKFKTKTEPYRWAIDNYLKTGKCNGEYAAYYVDQYWLTCAANGAMDHHQLTNHDFFISKRAFFFDLSPWEDEAATDAPAEPVGADVKILKEILSETYRLNGGQKFCHIGGFAPWAFKYTTSKNIGGKHEAVATEWQFCYLASAYNAFVDADALNIGAMANASFWQHYPVEAEYPQEWITRDELKKRGLLTADGKVVSGKKFILFYVGDFDSAAWIYQQMPVLWEDRARGSVPLMWSIDPILARRAPMVMDYLRKTATPNDYFASGDNGAGYLNPGMLETPRAVSGLPSGVSAWAEHNKPWYQQWGLSVTGFIIEGNGPAMSTAGLKSYATFSPNGIVPMVTGKQAQLVDGMPVIRAGVIGVGDGNADQTATLVLNDTASNHPDFPFYWYRAVIKSPTWYSNVKKTLERKNPDILWLSAPEYFELLRCYIEEGH